MMTAEDPVGVATTEGFGEVPQFEGGRLAGSDLRVQLPEVGLAVAEGVHRRIPGDQSPG